MELVNLLTNILDGYTRSPNFKPYRGVSLEGREEGGVLPDRIARRGVFVRKPEIASGEKFKSSIPSNPQDRNLTAPVSEKVGRNLEQIPERVAGVEIFPLGKIRQAV